VEWIDRGLRVAVKYTGFIPALLILFSPLAYSQESAGPGAAMFTVNDTWMLGAALFVFIAHLGFAMVESGSTRAKNTKNVLFKNTAVVAIGLLTYAIIGFNLLIQITMGLLAFTEEEYVHGMACL
jgi:Ammonium Transporter Family